MHILGKLVVLLIGLAMLYPTWKVNNLSDKLMCLALFAMISAPIAPVSWAHAYVVVLPGLVLLWDEALKVRKGPVRIALLFIATMSVTSFIVPTIRNFFNAHHHLGLSSLAALIIPGSIAALVLHRIWEPQPRETI